MAATGSSGLQVASVSDTKTYSVSRGATVSSSINAMTDYTTIHEVMGVSAATPAVFSDLSFPNENDLLEAMNLQATGSEDGPWNVQARFFYAAHNGGWNVGDHLWIMLFEKVGAPSGSDVPFAINGPFTVIE